MICVKNPQTSWYVQCTFFESSTCACVYYQKECVRVYSVDKVAVHTERERARPSSAYRVRTVTLKLLLFWLLSIDFFMINNASDVGKSLAVNSLCYCLLVCQTARSQYSVALILNEAQFFVSIVCLEHPFRIAVHGTRREWRYYDVCVGMARYSRSFNKINTKLVAG